MGRTGNRLSIKRLFAEQTTKEVVEDVAYLGKKNHGQYS
jgi:hypothetical protein